MGVLNLKKLRIFIIVLFSINLIPNKSFALSCVEPPPPDIAFHKYDAVIIGEVQNIEEKRLNKILTIKVEKSFKGVDEKVIKVEEDGDWGESQLNFDYLFFLNKEDEKWVHPLCSPTTNNASIANTYFANKKEIPLENVITNKDKKDENSGLLVVILLFIALSIVMAVVFIKRKRTKP
jgi:hypothetical protein